MREEIDGAKRYFDYRDRCIYCDMIQQELETGTRIVLETDHFVAVAPYAAASPSRPGSCRSSHSSHFENIEIPEVQNLGWMQRAVLRKIDKVLERPAYNFIIHTLARRRRAPCRTTTGTSRSSRN